VPQSAAFPKRVIAQLADARRMQKAGVAQRILPP